MRIGAIRSNGCCRGTLPFLVVAMLVAVLAAPSVSAQDSPPAPTPPPGFTRGAQGYLLEEGEFTRVAPPGATGTLSRGINDKGQIVGIYDDKQGRTHGFVLERGRYRTIDHPDATGTLENGVTGSAAFGINNHGQVLGAYIGPDNHVHVFLLDLRFRAIPDAPGATNTQAWGLNDRGQITIQASTPEEPFLHFPYDDGEFTRIQFPDAVDSVVHGINNRGEVVGVYVGDDIIQHGFILNHGRYRTIDFRGADHTGVTDRNDRGTIVGYVAEGDLAQPDAFRGALFSRGKLTLFDAPGPPDGPTLTIAYDINNRGQIVGAKSLLVPPTQQGAPVASQVPGLSVPSTVPSAVTATERDRAKDRDRANNRERRRRSRAYGPRAKNLGALLRKQRRCGH